jgi:hypothetical protein
MPYNWDLQSLDREYVEWLEIECKCPISEQACECMDFDEWFEARREFSASCHEGYCESNHEDYCA